MSSQKRKKTASPDKEPPTRLALVVHLDYTDKYMHARSARGNSVKIETKLANLGYKVKLCENKKASDIDDTIDSFIYQFIQLRDTPLKVFVFVDGSHRMVDGKLCLVGVDGLTTKSLESLMNAWKGRIYSTDDDLLTIVANFSMTESFTYEYKVNAPNCSFNVAKKMMVNEKTSAALEDAISCQLNTAADVHGIFRTIVASTAQEADIKCDLEYREGVCLNRVTL